MKKKIYSNSILLLKENGWDGKYPIPITYEGKVTIPELKDLNCICSGDDHCFWAVDVKSAHTLIQKQHKLITDPNVLMKRQAYLDNPIYKELYPFWYD